eukprot:357796-Chlamydomonas_euryale.AAC.1
MQAQISLGKCSALTARCPPLHDINPILKMACLCLSRTTAKGMVGGAGQSHNPWRLPDAGTLGEDGRSSARSTTFSQKISSELFKMHDYKKRYLWLLLQSRRILEKARVPSDPPQHCVGRHSAGLHHEGGD